VTALPDFSTRRSASPRPTEFAWVGVGLVALIGSAYGASSAWADLRMARSSVEAARRELATLRSRVPSSAPRPADDRGDQALLSLEAPPGRVLADIGRLLPAEARLDSVSLAYSKGLRVDLRVAARNAGAYDAFLRSLAESPLFSDVAPGPESREGEVAASIQLTYRGSGT